MYYKNFALSEGIDLNKRKDIKEGIVCHYWQLNHGFIFQKLVCNGFQDLLMMSPDINDIAVNTLKGDDYHCIFLWCQQI